MQLFITQTRQKATTNHDHAQFNTASEFRRCYVGSRVHRSCRTSFQTNMLFGPTTRPGNAICSREIGHNSTFSLAYCRNFDIIIIDGDVDATLWWILVGSLLPEKQVCQSTTHSGETLVEHSDIVVNDLCGIRVMCHEAYPIQIQYANRSRIIGTSSSRNH